MSDLSKVAFFTPDVYLTPPLRWCHCQAPFTRYNLLSNRSLNRIDNRLYRVNGVSETRVPGYRWRHLSLRNKPAMTNFLVNRQQSFHRALLRVARQNFTHYSAGSAAFFRRPPFAFNQTIKNSYGIARALTSATTTQIPRRIANKKHIPLPFCTVTGIPRSLLWVYIGVPGLRTVPVRYGHWTVYGGKNF